MTSLELPAPPNYANRALRDQHNVILMVGAGLFTLAFWSPLPLVIGGALEIFWLLILPRLGVFQSYANRSDAQEEKTEREQAMSALLPRLSPPYAARFQALRPVVEEAIAIADERGLFAPAERSAVARGFDRLRRAFIDAALTQRRVANLAAEIPVAALLDETEKLRSAATAEKNLELRMALRQTLNAADRRLKQREQLVLAERAIELKLQTIEESLQYLKGRVASVTSLAELDSDVAAAFTNIGTAAQLDALVHEAMASAGPSSLAPSWAPPSSR